jgi:tetratricopeptide (TPR) repeat protein
VPRDLDTICLKCLHKEPGQRYASAAALADDLRHFGEGRPIKARPVGWAERSWRWCRRKPAAAALLATALTLVGLATGGGMWLVQQRAERRVEAARHDAELRSEVGTAVAQAETFRQQFHFHQARQLLEQAQQRLEPAGPDDLCRQVGQAQAELNLAVGLDSARLQAATLVEGRFDPGGAERQYVSVFADAGLGREGDDVEAVAAAVQRSAVGAVIVAALEDWASITPDPARRSWLLAVACKADPDPVRDRLRQPELWQDSARLTQLAKELSVAELSPQLATALGRVARQGGGDAVPLLIAAQARFPQDFWLNYELGRALGGAKRWDEALGYYRAALVLRPKAHLNLGVVLKSMGRMDEAIDQFQQALRIEPQSALAHANLAFALHSSGRLDEAIDHYRQSLRLEPYNATDHVNLGFALQSSGRLDEAISLFREALRIDPKRIGPHIHLGAALQVKGRKQEAIDHYRQALQLDPKEASDHVNLGGALTRMGRVDEAIVHYQQALRIDPRLASAHIHLGIALQLKGRLDEAIGPFQQALRLDPSDVSVRNNFSLCLYAAACAATRVAAGQGPGDARPVESARADKRRQALDWLRADLALKANPFPAGMAVGQPLTSWQKDPALTGVRDPAELAKLPDAEREQWQRLWADVAAQRAADPLECATRREWARAAAGYARALERGPTGDGHFCFEHAAMLLLSGDRPGYAKACAHMTEKCGKYGGPRAYHVARACTMAPDSVEEATLPACLAEKELQAAARQFWSLTEQGALAYRAGRFQEAVALFEQSLKVNSKPGAAVLNWLWLALANQRLGKAGEARHWLGKAQAWLDQYRHGMPARAEEELGLHYHNWLEAHVLRREAEALLSPH